MSDAMGDRMKGYEARTEARLEPHLPIYARIDGRAFSRFTRGLERPFDPTLSAAMVGVTRGLVEHTHANIGYTQSDEISLMFLAERAETEPLFGGRVQKMTSVLASLAASLFMAELFARDLPTLMDRLPHFDCRVFTLPSRTEGANVILWRYLDAVKNSISMVAQANFSPKQLHGKHGGEMLEMLVAKGVNYHALPEFFRCGTFVRRVTAERTLTTEELARIPEKHRPTGPVLRSEIRTFTVPDLLAVTNREALIFDGADPTTYATQPKSPFPPADRRISE